MVQTSWNLREPHSGPGQPAPDSAAGGSGTAVRSRHLSAPAPDTAPHRTHVKIPRPFRGYLAAPTPNLAFYLHSSAPGSAVRVAVRGGAESGGCLSPCATRKRLPSCGNRTRSSSFGGRQAWAELGGHRGAREPRDEATRCLLSDCPRTREAGIPQSGILTRWLCAPPWRAPMVLPILEADALVADVRGGGGAAIKHHESSGRQWRKKTA